LLVLTALTVILPEAYTTLLSVTPTPVLASVVRFAVVVLINPDTGVQAGVETVHPYVLSNNTYPGKTSVLEPIAAGLMAEPAVLMM